MDHNCWVAIPAAGAGLRMNAGIPKQYLPLAGRMVIEHTLECFANHPAIKGVVVALADDDQQWARVNTTGHAHLTTVAGGARRSDSVLSALEHIISRASRDDWVLVHDAARPNVARRDLDALIDTLADDPVGGILAVPVSDTMKRSNSELRIQTSIDRAALWHALTPQMFRLGILHDALSSAAAAGVPVTDEASAVEHAGLQPRIVEGSAENIKITRPEDLRLAEFYLRERA